MAGDDWLTLSLAGLMKEAVAESKSSKVQSGSSNQELSTQTSETREQPVPRGLHLFVLKLPQRLTVLNQHNHQPCLPCALRKTNKWLRVKCRATVSHMRGNHSTMVEGSSVHAKSGSSVHARRGSSVHATHVSCSWTVPCILLVNSQST